MRLSQPRYAPVSDDDLTVQQAEVLSALPEAWRGLNLFRTTARAPEALAALLRVGDYVRGEVGGLAVRERELAILRTAWLTQSGYEWTQHVWAGRQAGLSREAITAVKTGPEAALWADADRALLAACDELCREQFVTSATWSALGAHFNDRQRMHLVVLVGHYVQVAMLVNTFGVQLDTGQKLDPDLARYADA